MQSDSSLQYYCNNSAVTTLVRLLRCDHSAVTIGATIGATIAASVGATTEGGAGLLRFASRPRADRFGESLSVSIKCIVARTFV